MSDFERGKAKEGDLVEWTNCDRRGVRRYQGVVIGESAKRNTHLRVRTENGIREVHRFHAYPLKDQ